MNNNKKLKDSENPLKFEDALDRLEKIVEEMEAGELSLDVILKKYEEGIRLASFCTVKLEEAEKKIELLTRQKDGSFATKPFEEGQEAEPEGRDKSSTENSNEQSLF